jgi:hypothetical protein
VRLIRHDRTEQRERAFTGTNVNLQTFARLQREGVRNALRTGAARYGGCRVISGESRDGYPALAGLRQSLRGRFTEQCPRVVVGLKQTLSGHRETRPCPSSRSVGRYIAPEHRAVFAKLPHQRGQPEVVVVPSLECESVEFSLVHLGPTKKVTPHELSSRAPVLVLQPVPGVRSYPAGLFLMLGPHCW